MQGPLTGNQVKFIRNHLAMSLREFAKFMGVTHQSIMRWEEKTKSPTHMGSSNEIVLRIKTLRSLHSTASEIKEAVNKVEDVDKLSHVSNKKFKSLIIPERFVQSVL